MTLHLSRYKTVQYLILSFHDFLSLQISLQRRQSASMNCVASFLLTITIQPYSLPFFVNVQMFSNCFLSSIVLSFKVDTLKNLCEFMFFLGLS